MVVRKSRFKIAEELVQPVLLFLACRTAWSHGKDTVCDLGLTLLDLLWLEDVRPEEGLRDLQKHQQLFGRRVTLFEVHSTRLIFGESKVVVAFYVLQPFKVLFKKWTPIIHWNNNCSVMCSNNLCLVHPSTRRFHHVSKFVNWWDVVLLLRFLYDAKTSMRGKLRVASNQKRIWNWKELENCPPS